jgi:hypothetical protein
VSGLPGIAAWGLPAAAAAQPAAAAGEAAASHQSLLLRAGICVLRYEYHTSPRKGNPWVVQPSEYLQAQTPNIKQCSTNCDKKGMPA